MKKKWLFAALLREIRQVREYVNKSRKIFGIHEKNLLQKDTHSPISHKPTYTSFGAL